MAKVRLKNGGKWCGTLPSGEVIAVLEGEVVEVSDASAAYLVGDDCSGGFELVKAERAEKGKKD